jgi:hypothetical protein
MLCLGSVGPGQGCVTFFKVCVFYFGWIRKTKLHIDIF